MEGNRSLRPHQLTVCLPHYSHTALSSRPVCPQLTHIHIHTWFCPRCLKKSNCGEEPPDNGLPSQDRARSPHFHPRTDGDGQVCGPRAFLPSLLARWAWAGSWPSRCLLSGIRALFGVLFSTGLLLGRMACLRRRQNWLRVVVTRGGLVFLSPERLQGQSRRLPTGPRSMGRWTQAQAPERRQVLWKPSLAESTALLLSLCSRSPGTPSSLTPAALGRH